MSPPTDSPPPAGEDRHAPATGAANSERPPRLSRPTPSQLFAERSDGEGNGARRRATRVIPELAAQVNAPETPLTAPASDSTAPEPERAAAASAPPAGGPDVATAAPLAAPAPAPAVVPLAPGHAPEFPPDLVFIVRPGGTILYVNRPLGRRSEEEVVGSLFTDWVFPEQHAAVRDALARVFGTAQADGVDLHGIQGHSPDAWFECRIAPNVRDGKVVSVTIIGRDVTRYKEIERGLRERHAEIERLLRDREADLDLLRQQTTAGDIGTRADEETRRFRAALETAGEAIFLLDPEQEVLVDLNDTACRWLRRHRGDLLGKAVASLDLEFPLLPPASFDASFTETRDSRRPLILEGEHSRQDGSRFPVEVSVISHQHEDHDYLLAVVRDVKDRRRAQDAIDEVESQYRSLFEQSFDAVYLTTRGGEIVEANSAASTLFGYRREEFIGLDARTVMPDVNDIRQFQRRMAAERFVARLEVSLRRRDGSAFAAVLSASRRRDANDRLLGYQWVVRAIPGAAGEKSADRGVPAYQPEPAVSQEARESAAPEPGGGVVLLVGGREVTQREGAQALERAGLAVIQAPDGAGAIRLIRTHDDVVQVAVVRGDGELDAEDIARDLRALSGTLRIVLVRHANADLMAPPDMTGTPVLRDPAHPLALVQAVREVLAQPVA